jgi:hypothetical protein
VPASVHGQILFSFSTGGCLSGHSSSFSPLTISEADSNQAGRIAFLLIELLETGMAFSARVQLLNTETGSCLKVRHITAKVKFFLKLGILSDRKKSLRLFQNRWFRWVGLMMGSDEERARAASSLLHMTQVEVPFHRLNV